MNPMQGEVEAYTTSDMETVMAFLVSSIGPLSTDCASDQDPQIYAFESTTVVLGASEDGFLSVWIRGDLRWQTSLAFGRYLAAVLDGVVRCDPGREFPDVSTYSNIFLHIEGGVESLVNWE